MKNPIQIQIETQKPKVEIRKTINVIELPVVNNNITRMVRSD